ncbi:MAG TPA: ribokinase [Polyangiaceae bacterium]|nr:ribokinase [Polyangiaceae bacterium]
MPRVHVMGSLNMDLIVEVARPPKPGETVFGRSVKTLPGGKGANQALAAARAGATVTMIGSVGKDAFGADLRHFLASNAVDVQHVSLAESAPTGTALVVVESNGENSIIVVPGANEHLGPSSVLGVPIASGDFALCQFETPPPTVECFFQHCRRVGVRTVLNPAPFRPDCESIFQLSDVLVLNETELSALAGEPSLGQASTENVLTAALKIRTHLEQTVVVTLGSKGAVAVHDDARLVISGWQVPVLDTTGAGDAFTGSLTAGLALGESLEDALMYANAAAAISVQRAGAGPSIPQRSEVERFLAERGPIRPGSKH